MRRSLSARAAPSRPFTVDGRRRLALFAVGSHGAPLEFSTTSGGPAWFWLAHDVASGDYALEPTSAGACGALRLVPGVWGRVTTATATAATQGASLTVLALLVPQAPVRRAPRRRFWFGYSRVRRCLTRAPPSR